jgi:hypothetical protein
MGEIWARSACAGTHTDRKFRRRIEILRTPIVFVAALLLGAAGHSASAAENALCVTACRCATANSRSQCLAESRNFAIRSYVGGPDAADVAAYCEKICAQLRTDVFGVDASNRWQPKCSVVIHATRPDYLRAVGRSGSQTVGSSIISMSAGRVTRRRIDLLGSDSDRAVSALAHEMTHVLFADAFPTTAPPKWAEEGLALLMDDAEKRARHARDLDAALQSRSTVPIARLLVNAEYPTAAHRAAFYAQSLSLVDYLTQLESPKEFLRFVKLSTERGHDHALLAVYGITSGELDRRWWQHALEIQLASAESR